MGQSILKDKSLSVIYNGIDTNTFYPLPKEQCRKELDLPLDKKIILSVVKKQDDQWKGWPFVIKVAEQSKNSKDTIFINIGRIAGNGSNFLGLPPVGDEEILAKYYSAADFLLYPSIADNCPLVVLEAMACGLPIVVFETGGIPELVEHKTNGYIAKYKDSANLKAGLEYLLNLSPEEIEKMRHHSINKTRSFFTIEKMTEKYLELYKSLIQQKSRF